MAARPKTCATCAHRNWGRCMLSGYYMETERKTPTVCGIDFHGWVQREPLFTRLRLSLIGPSNAAPKEPQR